MSRSTRALTSRSQVELVAPGVNSRDRRASAGEPCHELVDCSPSPPYSDGTPGTIPIVQRALFLYLPEDAWRARVVASKWVGNGRVVVAADDFGWSEVAHAGDNVPGLDRWERPPSIVVVLVTQETKVDPRITQSVEATTQRRIPIIGIDVSAIRDESGQKDAAFGSAWPEFRRYYAWWRDNGDTEIGEWIDFEIRAAAAIERA